MFVNKSKSMILGVLVLIVTAGWWLFIKSPAVVQEWNIDRTIRYAFLLENKQSTVAKDVEFQVYAPVSMTSTQQVTAVTSNDPFTRKKDIYGNDVLVFDIAYLAPFAKKKVVVTAQLKLSETALGAASEQPLYLTTQPQIELDDEHVIEVAQQFTDLGDEAPEQVHDWLVEHIEYSGYGSKDKGAAFAAKTRSGDCTEYAYLNTAINRILGIPARAVNGYVITQDAKLNPTDFHTWSEVWMDGGWQVVDPQKNVYRDKQHQYIAMNIVADTAEHSQFKKFWVSDPSLKVTMN